MKEVTCSNKPAKTHKLFSPRCSSFKADNLLYSNCSEPNSRQTQLDTCWTRVALSSLRAKFCSQELVEMKHNSRWMLVLHCVCWRRKFADTINTERCWIANVAIYTLVYIASCQRLLISLDRKYIYPSCHTILHCKGLNQWWLAHKTISMHYRARHLMAESPGVWCYLAFDMQHSVCVNKGWAICYDRNVCTGRDLATLFLPQELNLCSLDIILCYRYLKINCLAR